MTYMAASDIDFPASPSTLSDATIRELQARLETTISFVERGSRSSSPMRRGLAVNPNGAVIDFSRRDAAVCARALIDDARLLDHTTIYMRAGKWAVAGAWSRDALAGAA